MLNYSQFYTNNGIRQINQLISPPMKSLGKLYLPLNSAYHYLSTDEEEVGVTPNDPIMRLVHSEVMVEHITAIDEEHALGRVTRMSLQENNIISQYHRTYAKYRNAYNNKSLIKNQQVLLVLSYCLIARHYRYATNVQSDYDRWYNSFSAVVHRINTLAEQGDRQQFILLDVPTILPSIPNLTNDSKEINATFNKRFGRDAQKMILTFWQWLDGQDRAKSPLSRLTAKALKQTNLILQHKGMWSVISLGLLDGWRLESNGPDDKAKPGQINGDKLQLRFLRGLMSLVESATAASDEEVENEVEEKEGGSSDPLPDDALMANKTTKVVKPPKSMTVADIINRGTGSAPAAKAEEEDTDDEADLTVEEEVISDEEIAKDLAQLAAIVDMEDEADSERAMGYKGYTPPVDTPEGGIERHANVLARKGLISAAELRRFNSMGQKYQNLPNPFGEGTLGQFAVIDQESLKIAETTPIAEPMTGVLDQSMLSSSIKDMDDRYVKEVLNKDIVNMCLQIQRSGVIVTDYKVVTTEDYSDHFDTHIISLQPLQGKATTLRVQVPKIRPDATFKAAGVINHMRKQRGDVPIRKKGTFEVVLTSYYSKMFVLRSEKSVHNYAKWLVNRIIAAGINPDVDSIKDLRMGNSLNHEIPLPRAYTIISSKINGFTAGEYEFSFDWYETGAFFGSELIELINGKENKKLNLVPIAKNKDMALVMQPDGMIFEISIKDASYVPVPKGDIETVLGLDISGRPVDIAEVGIMGKDIPLGFLMAQHVGLGNLLATLKPSHRREKKGANYKLASHEYIIKFEDEVLILDRREVKHALIFAGFNSYHREIKRYSIYDFDRRDVYANILDSLKITARWVREFDLMFDQWVDPITRDLLVAMQEPTDLFNLFRRCAELLVTDDYPREMDMAYMRDKGYERISGMIYGEIIKGLRGYNSKPSRANASVDVNPMAVWMGMIKDQTVRPVDQSNPIQALKDKEVVIYSGAGGRSGQSMTASSRVFDRNCMGVTSEATVDSGDVATITYLTADPNYDSLRGTTRRIGNELKGKTAKLISTSWCLAPGADNDDGKRINFISIQNSQTTHCVGRTALPVRTGYERVMAHRCDELYAKVASGNGKIIGLTDSVITVEYDTGEQAAYPIGRQFGAWGGVTQPHDLVTDLKLGDKVKKGDAILYNSNYFVRDTLDPSQLIFTTQTLASVVLWESTDTLEDSNAITPALASRLATTGTTIRYITVSFDEEIRKLLKVGDVVTPESILCTIHPATIGGADLFDDEAIGTLSAIDASTPSANVSGRIDRTEVLYTGELDEMSKTLRALAEKSDFEIHKYRKQLKQRTVDGRVEPGFRANGVEVGSNMVVIKVYITGNVPMDVGDKCVFGNQMKSIVGRVATEGLFTEDGTPVEGVFSYDSNLRRIARSTERVGTTGVLCDFTGEQAVAAYES